MAIGGILSSTSSELTVNLTWSNSRCVVVYYVEVTATDTTSITNTMSITNTTSQYIVLSLQIGVVHSFRVRGADSINRLGEWSDYFVYTPVASKWKNAFTIIYAWFIMRASLIRCRHNCILQLFVSTCVVVVIIIMSKIS